MNARPRTAHVDASSDGSPLRFCDGVARILSSHARAAGGRSVVELTMPAGSAPPLQAHDEDATIVLLDGRVTFTIGREEVAAGPRTKIRVPAGVPYAHRVDDTGRARWLVTGAEGHFERFVRAVARPADEPVPEGVGRADAVAFTAAAAAHGIELLAPVTAVQASPRPRRRPFRLAPLGGLAPLGA